MGVPRDEVAFHTRWCTGWPIVGYTLPTQYGVEVLHDLTPQSKGSLNLVHAPPVHCTIHVKAGKREEHPRQL